MADGPSQPAAPPPGDDGLEPAPMEIEAPRRASSAQFVVDRSTGAQAAMREAMDPANQSLAEALRLSFRVLQVVIVILVALFLFSGFQTVQEGYTGVRTLFGRIYGAPGEEQIAPGPTLFWPYPVGEIVTVQARRSIDLSKAFWPTFNRQDMTLEQATERADVSQPIRPGTGGLGDGSLLTADGDLAHVKVMAEYTVEDAVGFLDNVDPTTIDRIVRMALQRGMVHTAAAFTLNELVELREEPVAMLREKAQAILNDQLIGAGTNSAGRTRTGVRLTDVQISARTAPLAIRKAYAQVQNSREEAKTAVEMARQEAQKILNGAAGPNYAEVSTQIEAYETALDADGSEAPAMLASLGELLDSDRVSGEAARIVSRARAFQAQVDATLGSDAQRFASLLPAYRENPELLVRNLWLQTYASVMANEYAEVFSMPWNLGGIGVNVESSPDMMQTRRRGDVERKKQEAAGLSVMDGPYLLRGRDIVYDKAGRRLNESAESGFGKDR